MYKLCIANNLTSEFLYYLYNIAIDLTTPSFFFLIKMKKLFRIKNYVIDKNM